MKITGTFLDEISYDIPHQNWGRKDWDNDFAAMKSIGIDTVILIRCGLRRFQTYPSEYLTRKLGCYTPPTDLVELFLELSEKYNMEFYFGLYDFGNNQCTAKEADLERAVAEEAWARYGHFKAFRGWYLNWEISRASIDMIDTFAKIGAFVKNISGNLPTMISPYIAGVKDVSAFSSENIKSSGISVEEHEKEWNEILSGIKGAVDIVAFQDGHCDFHELADYLSVNKMLTDRHGMTSWTNCESFDRDMPIKFLPIKWEKMLLKLEAARAAGIEKAITFEFSHFMSPNSCYAQAGKLFERYCEHFQIER